MKTGEKTPNLTLKLGFSHDIFLNIPAGVSVKCPNYSQIVLEGNNKNPYHSLQLTSVNSEDLNLIKEKVSYSRVK